ncbi:MAG: TetR/AcrR family transcriptional regulator [Dehalococcoidia bacterium]
MLNRDEGPAGDGTRASRTRQAILAATRELLAEGGVRRLTIEGVAARAGVAKTTIYRRWRSREELALAVLIDMVEQVATVPDLGDTRAELVAFVNRAVKVLRDTLMGRVMQGIVSELAQNPELAQAFRDQVVALRLAEVRHVMERGIARGDIRPDVDFDLAHELLFGPVYYRLLLSGARLDNEMAERVVNAVFPAFAATGPNRTPAKAAAVPST